MASVQTVVQEVLVVALVQRVLSVPTAVLLPDSYAPLSTPPLHIRHMKY